MTKRLVELSILTGDLEGAAAAWAKASGVRLDLGAGEGQATVGGVLLRFLSPAAGRQAAELVASRGDGMYELVVEVDDVVETMAGLRAKGVDVSGVELGEGGRREIRIDPASSHGVPIRLVEKRDA
ncbi:MAG TPA: hypothetical protein VNN10_10840 [Dehalococcoidia bacterium]|nr:hypothetical protein [Dehalococcoidia bacterium]